MGIQERILLFLSRKPGTNDNKRGEEWNIDNALSLLCRVFPDFTDKIIGKSVLDYGCGGGYQTVAMALSGAKYVLGFDISPKSLEYGRDLARQFGVENRVEFSARLDDKLKERFQVAGQSREKVRSFPKGTSFSLYFFFIFYSI